MARARPPAPLHPALPLVLTFVALLGGCSQPSAGGGASDKGEGRAAARAAKVVLLPASGAPAVSVTVELARTPDEQTRGLMFRRELKEGEGMLFLFERPEIRRFWMKNTLIPLDMLFLDGKRQVVGIEENTVPHDETGRGPDELAQYVLEVPGGYSRRHGVGLGSRASFVNVE